jgi:hypothetical protein
MGLRARRKAEDARDTQLSEQHREEMRREMQLNHLAGKPRAARKEQAGAGVRAVLALELKRGAGRLLNLRDLKDKPAGERRASITRLRT